MKFSFLWMTRRFTSFQSPEQVAAECGIAPEEFARCESGAGVPPLELLPRLALSDVNWRYVGIPEGRGFSPAVSAPHPTDGKHCFPGHPLPQRGGEGCKNRDNSPLAPLGERGWG